VACFNPNNTIFTQSSPRFKQMFMYMAGYEDEEKFDKEVARGMTVRGYMEKIKCPTLLVTGEFDPLCPLEDAVEAFGDLKVPKEMWVFENQYHPLWAISNLGGMDTHDYVLDWLKGLFSGKRVPAKRGRIVFGGLVPYGKIWRTGANAATQFKTDKALDFGGTVVPAGIYTIWSVPGKDGWKLRFNGETGQWGTAHKDERDLYTVDMKVSQLPAVVERFTISVVPSDQGGTLNLDWDTTRASVAFTVRP